MFIRGNELQPEPPVTPVGMGKATRGVELTNMDELDEDQVLLWMAQAAKKPFVTAAMKKDRISDASVDHALWRT